MPNHRRAFAIIAISAVLALTGGVTLALTTLRTAEAIASAQEADCPLLTAPTDDPTLVGITQARLEAQRTSSSTSSMESPTSHASSATSTPGSSSASPNPTSTGE